ncbi:MAG: hypothetical protein M3457_02875 [Chloroflexota bacterium]|nr:hypothetical protein [Chloroflexota bacterium]
MATTNTNQSKAPDPTVASDRQNARLEHSQGGITTRDDRTDVGVTMLPGDPSEPVGPEDALGAGPTRGDYRGRLGSSAYQPHTTVPVSDPQPGEATVQVVAQRPFAEEIGDVAGVKGGVDTKEGQR